MKLRPYQSKAVQSVFDAWKENRSALVVMPTGTGKTVLFSNVIKESNERAIVLCERRELVWQTAKEIKETTGLKVEIEMGEYKSRSGDLFGSHDVIVSSIQTLASGGDGGGRMGKFDPQKYGRLVIDECHHSTASSYKDKVIPYFAQNPNLKILGVTATPDRTDEEALGQVFDVVAAEYVLWDNDPKVPSAIRDGWLVPIVQQFVPTVLDLSQVRTTCGELNGTDLAQCLQAEKPMQQFVEAIFEIIHGLEPLSLFHIDPREWRKHVEGITAKRAVAFTQFVNHARMLSDILNRALPGIAAYVHGGTDEIERKKIIDDFKSDRGARILCNCDVISEGYNDAGLSAVFMCAPTKSRAKYAQRIGRMTRPHSSIAHSLNDLPNAARRRFEIARSQKPCATVYDFACNSGRHKLVYAADILGGNLSEQVIEEATIQARKSGKPVRMEELLEEAEQRLEEKKKRELEESARKARLVGKATYKMQQIDPFDMLQIKPVKSRGWDNGKNLSEKQRAKLRHFGFNPDEYDYAKGSQLLGIIFDRLRNNLCSLPQVKLLKKYGVDGKELTFDQARSTIDRIANNGWKKPDDLIIPAQTVAKVESEEIDSVPF